MIPSRALLSAMSAALITVCANDPSSAFSLTGRYEGTVACDSTTAGAPWSWGRDITLKMVQIGEALQVEYRYTDTNELGAEFTLYSGVATRNADHTITSAYFRSCDASFPADELVRMFPAAMSNDPFSFAADSIWVSNNVPNLPGLTVQSCRWSLTRVSEETPDVAECPKANAAGQ